MLDDVAELCRRLDGLPLAIELAAARTRALAPGDLLEVVDERLDVLGHRAGEPLRDTMRAAIEVSTHALAPDEHAFFRRLGVFTGPFDLGLAHAVAGEPGSDRVASMDLLADARRAIAGQRRDRRPDHALPAARAAPRPRSSRSCATPASWNPSQERFVEAMLAVSDRIVADAAEHWDAATADRRQRAVRQPRAGLRAVPGA